MKLDKEKIRVAHSLIHEHGDAFYHAGNFVDLKTRIDFGIHSNTALHLPSVLLGNITENLWNLETLIFRLNWQKALWSKNELEDLLWIEFAACDINLFHVQLRSIFDSLAKLIMCFAEKPGQVGTERSYRELQEWLRKNPSNSKRLGSDLAKVVLENDWFDLLRDIRDAIVHRNGRVIVFLEKGQILFQVNETFRYKISAKEVMYNENVADFEIYAAILVGYIFHYLEDVAVILHTKLNTNKIDVHPRLYHHGLAVLCSWFDRVYVIPEL